MKKSIKIFQVLTILAVFLFSSVKSSYVYAAEIASGTCGAAITWSLDSDGVLTISGSGDMDTDGKCAWADYADQVTSVVFEGDITSISDCAFERNSNLTSVVLPTSVTELGRRAFADCTSLTNVRFPDGLIEIGASAFYMCTSLDNVVLEEDLMYIRDNAFADCTSLKSLTIKSELVLLGESEYTLPENLEHLTAHKYGGAYYYARHNGITFTDVDTNETIEGQVTNEDYLDALPTDKLVLGVVSNSDSSEAPSNEAVRFLNEIEEDNETYKEIKSVVDEVTKDCTTDTEKAKAIFNWVIGNMKYGGVVGATASLGTVYDSFTNRLARCEGYTILTNYMLYLCDIPTATARNLVHQWSVAYLDGEWTYIDSTHYIFGGTDELTNEIVLPYDGKIYIINEPTEEIQYIKDIDVAYEEIECTHQNKTTHKAVASTCLVQGNGEYVTCDDCGKVISGSDEKLPLADHNYGELIEKVEPTHTQTELKAGMEAYYECSVCGKLFDENKNETTEEDLIIPAPEHSYDKENTDDDYHWKECGCGNIVEKEAHYGGEATCSKKAICEVCGKEYGEINENNHKNTEVRNEKEATCSEEGYTGDTYCLDCNKVVEKGETIEKVPHSGGEATCTNRAICKMCNQEYGELDANNHKNVVTENEKEATCEDEGYTGDKVCEDCGTTIETGTEIQAKGHTGGEATCISKAVCDVCGLEYGEVNANNHKNVVTENEKEATCEDAGYTGDKVCEDCGITIETGTEIQAKGHTGGEATCISKAVCDVCGLEYGEVNANNHKNVVTENEKEATCEDAGYTGDKVCEDCGVTIETGTEIEAKGHQGGEATCTNKAVCEVCGNEYGELNPDNHKNTEVRNKVEATEEKEGYTGDVYCLDCDKLVEEGKVIPVIDTEEKPDIGDVEKPEEVEDEEKEEPVKDEDNTVPNTGDNSNIILWISLLVISGISFVGIARWKTRKQTGKHIR